MNPAGTAPPAFGSDSRYGSVSGNKQAAGNTLSLLMQTGFSARAEIGLTGDDDLRVKVSPNGGDWFEALRIARETGGSPFPVGSPSRTCRF